MHHVGCLVDSILTTFQSYQLLYPKAHLSTIYNIESQKVRVAFLNLGSDVLIELVEVADENSSLNKMMKKGVSFYHLAFIVLNFDERLELLQNQNFRLISVFNSEAFENRRCAFLYSPEMQLLEIIEGYLA
ncbi:methylmalonyl-CoA epimerase [Pedobacter glucosidilyticus]|nr:methylmalonyl-CoA epimerase [Pedobacter glucosidilyticus]